MSPIPQPPLPVTACASASACGIGNHSLLDALRTGQSRLQPVRLFEVDFPACTGEIDNHRLPTLDAGLTRFNTRNARIALAALNHEADRLREAVRHARQRYGAHRIGVVLGTSTSGIYETENAYTTLAETGHLPTDYDFVHQHTWVASAHFLQAELQLEGPCHTISTACSSSSKTIISAQRLIHAGVCDAVLTGGVDSLCRMTLHGFKSLDLIAEQPCTPLDRDRSGISLGEGAGLLLLERAHPEHTDCVHLLGAGESSDAHHMTAPHPEGRGAVLAMQRALQQAGLTATDIDYVNLHATGTVKNDAAEMLGMQAVFGPDTPCSGTKGLTGHTLGAAGGIEAIIAWLCLQHAFMPGTCGLQNVDTAFTMQILQDSRTDLPVRYTMSNNFGFGGNNTSLLFGWLHD